MNTSHSPVDRKRNTDVSASKYDNNSTSTSAAALNLTGLTHEGNSVCKVLLMTTNDRYQPYFMESNETTITFYQRLGQEKGSIKHELKTSSITSIDSHERKCLCKSKRHFGALLTNDVGHRKLYFVSIEQMEIAINYILKAQKFSSRELQYKFVKQLEGGLVGRKSLVKHAVSGVAYELKAVSIGSHPSNLELFRNELTALQKLSQDKRVISVKDYWEDSKAIYMVLPYSKKDSLVELIQKTISEKGSLDMELIGTIIHHKTKQTDLQIIVFGRTVIQTNFLKK